MQQDNKHNLYNLNKDLIKSDVGLPKKMSDDNQNNDKR